MEPITSLLLEINIFLNIVDLVGPSQLHLLSATESKLPEKTHGLKLTFHHKLLSLVTKPKEAMDVGEVTQMVPTNTCSKTILLMKLAQSIKLGDGQTVWDVLDRKSVV